MINTKTYVTKANTIFRDSKYNVGLNPIMELNYGKLLSRGIIYIDHSKVQSLVEDKTYPNVDKLKHVLRMRNTASITSKEINTRCFQTSVEGDRLRAISFDLIFFHLPKEWDGGRGYDYTQDIFNRGNRGLSTQGSNWFNAMDYIPWDTEGVYSTERMSKELDRFSSDKGNLSRIIFGLQHFDVGNEDISLDITCTFNKFITGELTNNGFGIMFSPKFEQEQTPQTQYVGFFTQHTHSFFEPYVETTYDEVIEDDRTNFYLDKKNKLYFYSLVGGNYENLDEIPSCTIEGQSYDVKQATKGIYYVDTTLDSSTYEPDTMLYDVWSNISYNGTPIDDVKLQFLLKHKEGYFSFGLPKEIEDKPSCIPTTYGINQAEQITQGDIRKVNIDCRVPYTSNHLTRTVYDVEYRLYVVEADSQYDVIEWSKVERGYNEMYFLLNTEELLPMRYFVDIRVKENQELKYYYQVLSFDIISNISREGK